MTLQQTMSQLLFALLTVVGVLGMMIWISPLLAVIALVTVPVSILVTVAIGKRSQQQFIAQWATTGKLNGHIEEMFTGHTLVKVVRPADVSRPRRSRSTTTRCTRPASGRSSSPASSSRR